MKFYNAPVYTEQDLEQIDEKDLHFPYTDEDAIYDGKRHQYILTRRYFEKRGHNLDVEIDGSDANKVVKFLNYLSMKVYNRVYLHSKTPREALNYIIAVRGINGFSKYEYRETFLEAMYLEGCYLLDNGDISKISGVDLDTMQNMSIDVIRRQDRDFDKESAGLLVKLGLSYYGRLRVNPVGKGEDW